MFELAVKLLKSQDFRVKGYPYSSVKPLGGLLNFRHSRGGIDRGKLIREGALFTRSDNKVIYESFSVFNSTFCGFNIQFYE